MGRLAGGSCRICRLLLQLPPQAHSTCCCGTMGELLQAGAPAAAGLCRGVALLLLLQDGGAHTLALGQGHHGAVALANHKHVGLAGGEPAAGTAHMHVSMLPDQPCALLMAKAQLVRTA